MGLTIVSNQMLNVRNINLYPEINEILHLFSQEISNVFQKTYKDYIFLAH
jgi:hypothetical protein